MPLHGTRVTTRAYMKTHTHSTSTRNAVARGERSVCVHSYIAIVVAIKYIVLEGVFYNGFLLFIKTEGPL